MAQVVGARQVDGEPQRARSDAAGERQGRGRRLAPALVVLLLSLLGVGAGWRTARAQSASPQVVATGAGVTVAVPSGLREASGLGALPATPVQVEGLATFTDDASEPLSIQIRRADPPDWESLPAAGSARAAEWTQRFAEELALPDAYDFVPGRYDPERGALRLSYKVAGPSSAQLMLGLPKTHLLWEPTLRAGEDPALAKCVLRVLLGGQLSASEAELRVRAPSAATNCGLPEALVSQYLEQLGPNEFAPSTMTVEYLAFLTRSGTVGTLVMAPLGRQQAVDAAAEVVWNETQVAAEELLPVASSLDAFRRAQLAGITLGSIAAVLILGGALSWLLVRIGLRAPLAVGSVLSLLCTLALGSALLAGAWQLEAGVQCISYLVSSALAFQPLVHWLSSVDGSPLGRTRSARRARGLSTVEQIVLLVLLACVSIGAWRLFGERVQRALSKGADPIGALGALAAEGAAGGLDGVPAATLPSGPATGSPSSAGSSPAPGGASGPSGRNGTSAPNGANARSGASSDPRTSAARPPLSSAASGSPGATRSSAGTGATRSAAQQGAASERPLAEARGSAVQGAVASALQAMQPGRVPASGPPAPLPPSAGKVVASAAKSPSLLLRGADIATDLVPYLSNVKNATIALTGVNPVTKERVGTLGRVVAGVFAVPGGGNALGYAWKGAKYVLKGGQAAFEAGKAAGLGVKVAALLGREAEKEIAEEGAQQVIKEAERVGARAGSESIATEIRYGPIHVGPLEEKIANTFRGGSYTALTSSEPVTLYRVYGGKANQIGGYWTRIKPSGGLQAQLDSALLPKWGNTVEHVAEIRVPAGTTIYEGYAAPQAVLHGEEKVGEILGGGSQVYIPKVDKSWLVK